MSRLVPILLLIGCSLVLMGNLGGCGQKDGVVVLPADPPRLDAADSENLRDCAWPATAKPGAKTQDELETLLNANAWNQIVCWKRHHGLIAFVKDRDGGLAAIAPTKK